MTSLQYNSILILAIPVGKSLPFQTNLLGTHFSEGKSCLAVQRTIVSRTKLSAFAIAKRVVTMSLNHLDLDDENLKVKGASKVYAFSLNVDENSEHRAIEIKFCSIRRPHMRSFYVAMFSLFIGMYIWFSISPLQVTIRDSVPLSGDQALFNASLCAIGGSFLARLAAGSLCDSYGAKIVMSIVLLVASLATGLTALVNSDASLAACRFFSGVAGSSLVVAQFWMSKMFGRKVIGTATATVLGIGYMGGGFSLAFLGTGLLPLFETYLSKEQAWRVVLTIPAISGLFTILLVLCFSDDTPQGPYRRTRKSSSEESAPPAGIRSSHFDLETIQRAARSRNTWILAAQYGASSGTNSALSNVIPVYFEDVLGTSSSTASAIASSIGWLAVTCVLGGYLSDKMMIRRGIKGRWGVQSLLLIGEGVCVIGFALVSKVGPAAFFFASLSFFATITTGSTFGLVPYVDPSATGSVAGIVGAGGSIGAIVLVVLLKFLDYFWSYITMGCLVFVSGMISTLFRFDTDDAENLEINDSSAVLDGSEADSHERLEVSDGL